MDPKVRMSSLVIVASNKNKLYEKQSANTTGVDIKNKVAAYTVEDTIAKGKLSWELKHSYLGCDPSWHELWELTIPNSSCSCSIDYAKLKQENPPDFSSPEKYFLWGHLIHNLVNTKLEKPLVTLEDAIKLWNRTDISLPIG